MISIALAVIYVLCAFGVGYLGRRTRAGFIGVTLLALVLTPLVMFIVVLLLRPYRHDPRRAN